jgi:hypothetical protein
MIAGWRGKLLTQAERLVLIKTCIASIPIYLLSFFKFPKCAIDLINSHMTHCFWDSYEGHRKMHLANWHLICMKKKHGGLGVLDIKDLNLCLLGSRVKRYILDENKIWRKVVHNKYGRRRNIFWFHGSHASHFWKGIIYAAQALKFGYRWVHGDGRTIRFWEDTWFGTAQTPLLLNFGIFMCFVMRKLKLLQICGLRGELRVTFRRTFDENMLQSWDDVLLVVETLELKEGNDSLV